jgi:hypothetical protein
MMDLMNQSGSRYKRESAKLRKLFTPVFEEVDVGLDFTGLDVKFQSTKSSGRKRRAINYAIAEISVHFTKVLLASEYVDTDEGFKEFYKRTKCILLIYQNKKFIIFYKSAKIKKFKTPEIRRCQNYDMNIMR